MFAQRNTWLFASILGMALSVSACSSEEGTFYTYKDPSEAPQPIRDAAQAVVRIGTRWSSATGSFISADGLLLTNNHVLGVEVCPRAGCFAKLNFFYERGQPFLAPATVFVEPVHVDVGLDMALVQVYSVDDSGMRGAKLSIPHPLSLSKRDAASLLGSHVNVVGHPHGTLKKWSEGEVVDADGLWFRDTATSLPGNSGSPVLDDEGRIIGLLHRGTRDPGLITEDGANLYSIATASDALMAAMQRDLPDTEVALDAPATAADIAARELLYYNGHVPTGTIDGGMTMDVLAALGDACDAGLARDDYLSPEDLSAGLAPCQAAMGWILCAPSTSSSSFGVCPDDAGKKAWSARYHAAFEKQRALNGELWLDMVSFAPGALETSSDASIVAGKAALSTALGEAKPPIGFGITPYLAAFNIDEYGGEDVARYVASYADQAHYEMSAQSIVYGSLWLESRGVIPPTATTSLLSSLAADDKLDLNDKLLVEARRYERREIE